MATQRDINSHDGLLDRLANEFARGLAPLFREFYAQLAEIENPTRTDINRLSQPLRRYAQTQLTTLTDITTDSVEMNAAVLGDTIDPTTQASLSRLREETAAAVNAAIDEEMNAVAAGLTIAAIVAATSPRTRRELAQTAEAAQRRLRIAFNSAIRQYDGALTILRGRNSGREVRYRYAGGVVAETRPFCEQMNGQVLTEAQIRQIWNTQTWAGKRPGDPFVVRGGYNCRHFFVPVAPEEE